MYCAIHTTFDNDENMKDVINSLLEKRMVSCAQVVPMHSYYHWQGKVASEDEKLVILKTKKSLYIEVEAEILRLHTYDTPQVICFAIEDGSEDYLRWIKTETK